MFRILSFLLISLLLGCRTENQRDKLVFFLKNFGEFHISELSKTEIIRPLDQPQLWSTESIINVSIDFQKLDSSNIILSDKKIKMILPKPFILSHEINPKSLEIKYTQKPNIPFVLTPDQEEKMLIKADQQLKNSIDTIGIISKAEENLTSFLSGYLKSIGYTQISIRYSSH
ncbi:MAG: hypothetical protein RL335_1020 [Bacteroidota bacterium]